NGGQTVDVDTSRVLAERRGGGLAAGNRRVQDARLLRTFVEDRGREEEREDFVVLRPRRAHGFVLLVGGLRGRCVEGRHDRNDPPPGDPAVLVDVVDDEVPCLLPVLARAAGPDGRVGGGRVDLVVGADVERRVRD